MAAQGEAAYFWRDNSTCNERNKSLKNCRQDLITAVSESVEYGMFEETRVPSGAIENQHIAACSNSSDAGRSDQVKKKQGRPRKYMKAEDSTTSDAQRKEKTTPRVESEPVRVIVSTADVIKMNNGSQIQEKNPVMLFESSENECLAMACSGQSLGIVQIKHFN